MAEKKIKPISQFVSRNLSESLSRTVDEASESGLDFEEFIQALDNEPVNKIAQNTENQEDLDELVAMISKGSSIPGQSLTNSPDQKYPWESPPKFANPREALTSITTELLDTEKIGFLIDSLAEGMAVTDITTSILFAKFYQGEINPDTMLLLIEPVMYTIMSIGSEAGIEYNIEPNDVNESFDEMDEEFEKGKLSEFNKAIGKAGAEAKPNINNNIKSEILPKSLLEKIEDKGPEIRSLLNKQEEE
jgi:hypothetical protein